MKTLNTLHKATALLPEWVYGRKWTIGLLMAMKIGLAIEHATRPVTFVA